MVYRFPTGSHPYSHSVPLNSSTVSIPNKSDVTRTSTSSADKSKPNIPLKVANIVNAPLRLTNKVVGKVGGDMGTIGGAIIGGVTGSVAGTIMNGSMMGLLGGGIGFALGGGMPAIIGGILGLCIGGGSGGITGGIKGIQTGAKLGNKASENIFRFPLDVVQKGIETISNIGIGIPIYLYDKVKS